MITRRKINETKPRRQCRTCPWRADVDPTNIPEGHGRVDGRMLALSVADGLESLANPNVINAECHAYPGTGLVCVGWLVHQLGPGQNFSVRMKVIKGRIDANVETVGPQRNLVDEMLRGDR